MWSVCPSVTIRYRDHIPYILAYKSKNFGQIFALKVGGSTYTRVMLEQFNSDNDDSDFEGFAC